MTKPIAAPDYVLASQLEVTILRPSKNKVMFQLTKQADWDALWELDHPRQTSNGGHANPPQRVPTVFSLTLISLPGGRRANVSEMSVSSAIAAARGVIDLARDATAADIQTLGQRMTERSTKFEDNRRNGRDRNR